MKKTPKTLLTAAAFAAAVNMTGCAGHHMDMVSGKDYAANGENNPDDYLVTQITDTTTTIPQLVYGPPPDFDYNNYENGDLNGDGVIDVFDIAYLRSIVEKANNDQSVTAKELLRADINNDLALDDKDIALLNDYLLGRRKYFTEIQTKYGPPFMTWDNE